jgi:hypothetical protein
LPWHAVQILAVSAVRRSESVKLANKLAAFVPPPGAARAASTDRYCTN